MKKLLIMASLFWPQKNSGGPPVSIMNLVQSVQHEFEIYIIANNHELNDNKPLPGIAEGWNEFSFGKAWYVPHGQHTVRHISALIRQVQPDVIYQNSFFSYNDLLPVLLYKKRNPQVRVVVAPRGEFYPERFRRGHTKKSWYCRVLRASRLLSDVYFQGTGEDECNQVACHLGVPGSHLLNIQNLSVVGTVAHTAIKKEPGQLTLAYIARIHPTKNTLQAIRWLGQVGGNITYNLYGPIEDEEYWRQCQEAIKDLPNTVRVAYRGVVDHTVIAQILADSHAYYMPTAGENFGHSIVESLLVGRPVVISDQTPWNDVNGKGGYVCPIGDGDSFASALNRLCEMGQSEYDTLCTGAKTYIEQKLNTQETVSKYIKAFDGTAAEKGNPEL